MDFRATCVLGVHLRYALLPFSFYNGTNDAPVIKIAVADEKGSVPLMVTSELLKEKQFL